MQKNRPGGKEYIYVNDNDILKINIELIDDLKRKSQENKTGKATLCLHNDIGRRVHEMINVYEKGLYIRPHMHPNKTETKIMIEGKMLVVIFDNRGNIIDKFEMGRKDSDIFTFRMMPEIYHTNIPITNVVFHEVIEGPYFGESDNIFPNWAPKIDDKESINLFYEKIGYLI